MGIVRELYEKNLPYLSFHIGEEIRRYRERMAQIQKKLDGAKNNVEGIKKLLVLSEMVRIRKKGTSDKRAGSVIRVKDIQSAEGSNGSFKLISEIGTEVIVGPDDVIEVVG